MSNFLSNLGWASEGIIYFFRKERNGRIQGLLSILIIGAGFYFNIRAIEWCFLLGCIALIMSLEMINTAIERVCEMLSKEYHPTVKIIKDVAAGAVWWSAIFAAIIGALIFYPYISKIIKG